MMAAIEPQLTPSLLVEGQTVDRPVDDICDICKKDSYRQ
jgi:hypothetical protein